MDKVRRQVSLACDFCYGRKIRCNRARPQCGTCHDNNVQCKFSRLHKSPRKYQRATAQDLEERIARVEKLLRQQNANPNKPAYTDASSDEKVSSDPQALAVVNRDNIQFAKQLTGSVNADSSVSVQLLPICSPQLYSGQPCTTEILRGLDPGWQIVPIWEGFSRSETPVEQNCLKLPKGDAVKRLVAAYYSSPLSSIFPVLDRRTFHDTIKLAYEEKYTRRGPASHARAAVFSFLALMFVCRPQLARRLSTEGGPCSLEAHRLILENLEGPATLDALQAIVTLVLFTIFSGAFDSVDPLLSFASRSCFSLQHLISNSGSCGPSGLATFTPIQTSHLRTLFWISYKIDKEMSLRSGRPPCFDDNECDLTLPDQPSGPTSPETAYSGLGCSDLLFTSEAKLSIIKSRIYKSLYSRRALKIPDAEVLQSIRELDRDLEYWRLSLPADSRPTLFLRNNISATTLSATSSITYLLEYLYCLTTIHHARRRCRETIEMNSSLELSIEASRSTLHYLYSGPNSVKKECSRYFLCHFALAVTTIFYNLLKRPLAPHSRQDLNLLEGLPARVREVLADQMPVNGAAYMDSVEKSLSLMGAWAKSNFYRAQAGNQSIRGNN